MCLCTGEIPHVDEEIGERSSHLWQQHMQRTWGGRSWQFKCKRLPFATEGKDRLRHGETWDISKGIITVLFRTWEDNGNLELTAAVEMVQDTFKNRTHRGACVSLSMLAWLFQAIWPEKVYLVHMVVLVLIFLRNIHISIHSGWTNLHSYH